MIDNFLVARDRPMIEGPIHRADANAARFGLKWIESSTLSMSARRG